MTEVKMHHMCRRLGTPIDIHIPEEKLIDKSTPVFTIGSCFATEIRNWLTKRKFNILPVNGEKRWGHDNLAWYNTYSLVDEFRIAERGRFAVDEYFWETKRGPQDPFRRLQFGRTENDLRKLTADTDERIRSAITTAKLVVVTLGLIECWKTHDTHKVICAWPGYGKGGGQRCRLHVAGYMDNYRNVHEIVTILLSINPHARLIMTVSPVQLGRTFRTCDQVVANCESKSTLRAVAGAIQRDFGDTVIYFPSYEMATTADRNETSAPDGRHIQKGFVQKIMDAFAKAYVK